MRTFGVVMALVAVAALAWLFWQQEPAGVTASPAITDEVTPAPVAASQPVSSAAAPAEVESPAARVAVSTASDRKLARLFGRCVDTPGGAVLAGCELTLNGWGANTERIERHGKKVEWKNPPKVVTGADGRFEFSFHPPPPWQFALRVRSAGRVSLSARWSEIQPGEQKDLGDVVLPPGTRVTGRVIDSKGAVQPLAQVYLERQERGEFEGLQPTTYINTTAGENGSFAFEDPLLPGVWSVRMGPGMVLQAPKALEIKPGATEVLLEVTIVATEATDVIEGVVLDANDQPVPRLSLQPTARGSGDQWILSTGRDGRFRYVRGEDMTRDPVGFAVQFEPGFENMTDDRRFAWGTRDVVLRVRRALAVEVQALDGATGAPITEFGVRCFVDPMKGSGWSSQDFALRAQGRHEQGLARVEGVRRGSNLLTVEPVDRETFAPMPPLRFEMTDTGAPLQVVRVPRFATRTLEVVRKDGAPVAGSKVEVVVPVDERPVTLGTVAIEPHQIYQRGNMHQALLICSAQTDATGRCELRGPGDTEVCIRVLGPGHKPVTVPAVRLQSDPLRVVVGQGATLIGKVVPQSLIAQWAPPPARTPAARDPERAAPGVSLCDAKDWQRAVPADRGECQPLARDGTFRLEGIDPGDWDLCVWYPTDRGSNRDREVLARVAGLAEGETREVVVDASILVPGELRGLVLVDGSPLANNTVGMHGTRPDSAGKNTWLNGPQIKTDGEGRFTTSVRSGDWVVHLKLSDDAPGRSGWIQLPTVATVRSSQTTEAVFRLDRQRLQVQLRSADGKPVANRDVDVSAGQTHRTERTDAQGRFTLDPALPGTMTFFTWPEHLASQDQRTRLWNQLVKDKGNANEVLAQRIRLGEFTVPAGETSAEVTFRLAR